MLNMCRVPGLDSALEHMRNLKTLGVGGCTILERLAPRRCLRLRCIDARGCLALRTLLCRSPALHDLNVHACPELEVRLLYAATAT